ncbi:hypothetical protein PXD56_02655 [Maribacter sp. SA7]|uniref:hypothetical protein n=1 Tax=Maribacter zhoushanensis TaxID=3030012 RepID=UPI0023EAA67B|nr:hypothetical protein [Maribacter zhoushanensis]MDF4201838.1 hypothetical protein [Maribacter zhoushanensis]
MKKFILNCVIGIIIVFVLDFAVGESLEYFYFKQTSGFQYRTTYSMEKTNEDILVFGSSRANHHYKPSVFKKKLNSSFYNTGRDGNFIFYQTAVLKSILKRYKPKLILYDFTGEFNINQTDYDRLSSLLPYYKNHSEIRNIVNLRSQYEPVKNFSRIYPYNSTIGNIAIGNININGLRTKDKNGYVPLYGEWKEPLKMRDIIKFEKTDKNKINVFKDFLSLCKENGIAVMVIVSPVYYTYDKDYSLELCEEICNEYKIPFFNFTKNQDFLESPYLFDDVSHLNDKGATLFSEKVADLVRED